jgi:hypothetical protein
MTVVQVTEPRSDRPLPVPDFMLKARLTLAHREIRRSLAAVAAQMDSPDHPWRRSRLLDFAIAQLSAHIAAMRATLYPAARRALPDSRAQVAAYRQAQRGTEQLMLSLHQVLHGDARAPRVSRTASYRMLSTTFEAHAEREVNLLATLQQVNTFEQQRALMRNIKVALAGAPTRPHPYLPRALGRARPVSRVVAKWDGLLDEVQGRSTHRGNAAHPVR